MRRPVAAACCLLLTAVAVNETRYEYSYEYGTSTVHVLVRNAAVPHGAAGTAARGTVAGDSSYSYGAVD